MDISVDEAAPNPATRALAREVELIGSAIAMVASGGASRVSVAGLRFGDQLLRVARQMAREAGVRVEPQWTIDEEGVDLWFERSADG